MPGKKQTPKIQYGNNVYRSINLYDLCKNWKKKNEFWNPKIKTYRALKDRAQIILKYYNSKISQKLFFKKNAKVTISPKYLKYDQRKILEETV